MGIIKILDENVSNIIAAGEVVENPASMLKELYENSVDAKSSSIEISMKSDLSYFKIVDDGIGMKKEDVYLCIQRHATSKLQKKEDIFNLKTFGFRGEALASISSVSKLCISSKTDTDKLGTKITVYGGNIINDTSVAMKTGCIIEIRDLFYNTPARKKFLRKEKTEISVIKDILVKLALSNPLIKTKLIIDSKVIFSTSGTNMDNTIIELLGKNIFKNLKKFKYGYLGNQEIYRGTKNYIYTYINNRYCKSNVIERAVIDGYYTKLMKHKYPFALILYDIDPTQIDVNVHPSKKIIKFSDDKIVYKQIRTSIEEFFYEDDRKTYTPVIHEQKEVSINENVSTTQQELFTYDTHDDVVEKNNYDILAQVFDTYIIVKNKDSLDFYDQHAMHERITYEALKDKYYNQQMAKKQLLIPEVIELSLTEKNVLLANIKIFEDFKFELDEISETEIIIRAVPDFELRNSNERIIKGIIECLMENKTVTDIREKVIISMACRTSIMAGQKLSYNQMTELVNKLHEINKFNCPHGRPVISTVTKNQLDKLSKRKI
ncbi:DNA mismatch repair endonuclease MutL [Sneathia sp. DSM 16631]|uniref:DNA mismatch repair endonuclease MutL n=1 Tax=Sneathia TaxID=168808 RepID=UPI001868ABA4|nr:MULTISPECIES: DNA mismatch repair endonuclease MutL [Sneathia]MBE3030829.1 DNA mismatch repair endonuclease MutL [Sneathia sp. DSM 16631]MDK9581378.1 DNA mismatch repair endonuclease MutL [Sneathia vaginalis]